MTRMNPNPYEAPQVPESNQRAKKGSAGKFIGAIVLALLAMPASLVACFATCMATFGATRNETLPWITGGLVGVGVAVTMIVMATRLSRTK